LFIGSRRGSSEPPPARYEKSATRVKRARAVKRSTTTHPPAPRLFWAAGFIIVFHHLRNQSVGALRLYFSSLLSGSPVMRGELARSLISPPPLLLVVSKLTTVSCFLYVSATSGFQAGAGISAAGVMPGLGSSSPSGVGRGPVGTAPGFLSSLSCKSGRPNPARAQLTS